MPRGGAVFAYANVLEEHNGETVAVSQADSKCKIEPA